MKKAAQATPNKYLVSERLKHQWSQKDLAAMIGTTRINVSRWERGITVPSLYFRHKLGQLFNKSWEELSLSPLDTRDLPFEHEVPEVVAEDIPTSLPEGVFADTSPLSSASTIVPLAKETFLQMPEIAPSRSKFTLLLRHHAPFRLSFSFFFSLLSIILSLLALFYVSPALTVLNVFSADGALQQRLVSRETTLEQRYFQSLGIGISGGAFIFDTYAGRTDISLKKQAAAQLLSGNPSYAVNLMTQAVSIDVSDGEIQIYNENLHVLQSGSTYITIVLGLAIAGDETNLIRARSIMQAAFLLQHEANSKGLLPHGLHLRILIDNSGSNNANVAMAAQFIANRVNSGNPDHIVGVVGWPSSSQTMNALSSITGAHLPMISQTASSVTLNGIDPYFFRVNPTDSQQGNALGVEAIKNLHAKNILLLSDPTDPYSVSLTNAFYDNVAAFNVHVFDNTTSYTFGEGKTTVQDYLQNVIPIVLRNHIDLIFLAGFDDDAIRLAHAVGFACTKYPASKDALANISILSGDATATNLILGVGVGPDSTLAKQFPQDMRHLIFSSFATASEWSFDHVPVEKQPTFFSDWHSTYYSMTNDSVSELTIDDHAILTYDALQMMVRATTIVQGTLSGKSIRTALLSFGHSHTPAFQGVSGLITFDDQGNPINKALVILSVKSINNNNSIVLRQVIGPLTSS